MYIYSGIKLGGRLENLKMEVTKIVTTSENVVIVQLVFNDCCQTIIVSIFVEHATTFYRDLCVDSNALMLNLTCHINIAVRRSLTFTIVDNKAISITDELSRILIIKIKSKPTTVVKNISLKFSKRLMLRTNFMKSGTFSMIFSAAREPRTMLVTSHTITNEIICHSIAI